LSNSTYIWSVKKTCSNYPQTLSFGDRSQLGVTSENRTVKQYQLSLTNLHDMLHYGKRAANKGGCSVW